MVAATNGSGRGLVLDGKLGRGTPFGDLVRKLRAEKGMTQQQVADLAGLSVSYVGLIELGERGKNLTDDKVRKFCQGLNATVAETEDMMRAAGMLRDDQHLISNERPSWHVVTRHDQFLTDDQKETLIKIYESWVPQSRGTT